MVRAVVARLFRAVEQLDAEAYLDRTYHPDVTIHEAASLPYGGDHHGHEGVVAHAEAFLRTWGAHRSPGEQSLDPTIDAVHDHAFVRWTLKVGGRSFPAMSHYRFRAGLIVESRMYHVDTSALVAWWRELEGSVRR